ncbi:MAG: energy-coupling factor transporter ATPase [Acutalibacteraceae bacterium]|jgi:energy-coupling factor transport system ATP-binding protein
MNEHIINFENVNFTYDSQEDCNSPVLRNLSLSIDKGEFVAVLGHNGSGKSTLAKLTNAILIPSSGTVTVNGLDTKNDDNTNAIRQTVGMVFQNPDNQIVATIVEDDVAFGPENLGVPPAQIRQRVDEALAAVGMYEYRDREPHKLSGGQKQRVAIAGILAMQTDCMVLDEPTAMLDPRGRAEVLNTVLELNREKDITVIYITHFMDEAVEANRVLVMDNGEIVLDGTPKEVFSQVELLQSIGLDVPQASELCYLMKKEGLPLPNDVLNAQECIDALVAALEEYRCP